MGQKQKSAKTFDSYLATINFRVAKPAEHCRGPAFQEGCDMAVVPWY